MVTATLLAGTPGVSAPGGMRLVGYFDRRNAKAAVAANGNILIDAAARRAYQAVAVSDTTIFEYDLDTMLVLRSVTIPLLMVADTRAGPVEWLWTLDEVNRRIFTFERRQGSSETYHLMIIDLATLSIGPVVDLWPLGNRLPLAISYDAQSDSVYLMTMVANINLLPNRGEVYFVEQRTASGRLDWEYRLASCFGAQDQQYPPTLVRSQIQRQFIYLNCYNSGGVQGQIVRLHLRADGQVESGADEVFPAVPPAFSTMFDRGSDRMFFLTTNSGAGRGAWVFDGLRSTFLGVIATGDSKGGFDYSMGLDPVTGRLYLHSPIGLVVADARRTPLGGGLVFHEYAGFGTGAIQVDPATRHVFVPDTTSRNSVGQPLRYMVLADELQASSATVIPDPDALTTDVAEAPNVTGVNFSGAASAFGLRTLTTGGLQRGAWNIALGQFSTDELQVVWTGVQTVPLDEGNREFHAARVRSVSLTNTGADADAVVSEVDEATRTDLNQVETDWPAQSAECHDAGGAPDDGIGDQGLAVASCNVGTRSVSASAGVPTLAFDSPTVAVSARALQAASSVSHDSAKGLVSHSSAVVRDLSIAGK
ncbi:MAG TPA: hypothetical protein VI541_02675, partial [Actinomycetota bacterium]|nr:hypothetical protein [Actinomycetota bacterium]